MYFCEDFSKDPPKSLRGVFSSFELGNCVIPCHPQTPNLGSVEVWEAASLRKEAEQLRKEARVAFKQSCFREQKEEQVLWLSSCYHVFMFSC